MNYNCSIKIWFFAILVVALTLTKVEAQSEVSVDNFTGLASINIPICDCNIKGYNSNVFLSYSSNSVKVQSGKGDWPEGWTLSAGRRISRILKGLPGEYQKSGDSTHGGLNTTIQELPQSLSILSFPNSTVKQIAYIDF